MKRVLLFCSAIGLLILCLCGCQKSAETSSQVVASLPADVSENATAEETPLYESLSDRLTREIDGAYQAERQKPENSSTAAVADVAAIYTEKWAQIAEKCYNAIMAYEELYPPSDIYYSSDDLHSFVTDMKMNWEQYSQRQEDNYLKVMQSYYQAGTIVVMIMADYTYDMQMNWALELAGICDTLGIDIEE